MASVDHVDTTVSLLDLLRSRVVLPHLIVDKPLVNLEEAADGKRNWYFDKQQSDSSTSVVIDEVVLNEGHVGYVVKHRNTDVQIDLATLSGENVDTKGGGATNGIGLALTRKLSQLGGTVVAIGRSSSKLEQLRKEIPSVRTLEMDLADLESVARGANELVAALKESGIDIIINLEFIFL